MSIQDQIRPALEGPLSTLGLVIENVTLTPAGRRRLLRVYLDRALPPTSGETTEPTEPLSLDDVADATRVVSDALDTTDVMGEQPYVLEVTSPGVERPLRLPRHFRRNVGRLIVVTTTAGEQLRGRVRRAGEASLTLDVPAEGKRQAREVELAYAGLSRAVVQVEFARGPDGDRGDHSAPVPGEAEEA